MNSNSETIDSTKSALRFFVSGVVVGLAFPLAIFLSGSRDPAALIRAIGICGLLGFLFWIVAGATVHNQRRARERLRRRLELGLRSPWGELRTEEPTPYSDRLAHYLIHDTSPETAQPTTQFVSKMPFWSLMDWRKDPGAEAKPAWFIRRILHRIRDAVHG